MVGIPGPGLLDSTLGEARREVILKMPAGQWHPSATLQAKARARTPEGLLPNRGIPATLSVIDELEELQHEIEAGNASKREDRGPRKTPKS